MFGTFLDAATLCTLFDAPGPAVQRTMEQGGWGGMLWPGHPAWVAPATRGANDLRTGEQLLALALHYFTTRHPDADALQICTAAQVLTSNAVGLFGGYPVEEDPRYEQAEAWLLSLAGGTPPAPGEIMALTPPYDANGIAMVPGGDLAAFTRAMVGIIEALVFTSEAQARTLAEACLRQAGDLAAQRAADIFHQCVLGQGLDVDAPVSCGACGAAGLDLWYTGQTWGETLCEACFAARVETGQARPQ
jgi:hypothetical protein